MHPYTPFIVVQVQSHLALRSSSSCLVGILQLPPHSARAASCPGARTPCAVTHPSFDRAALFLPKVGTFSGQNEKSKLTPDRLWPTVSPHQKWSPKSSGFAAPMFFVAQKGPLAHSWTFSGMAFSGGTAPERPVHANATANPATAICIFALILCPCMIPVKTG